MSTLRTSFTDRKIKAYTGLFLTEVTPGVEDRAFPNGSTAGKKERFDVDGMDWDGRNVED